MAEAAAVRSRTRHPTSRCLGAAGAGTRCTPATWGGAAGCSAGSASGCCASELARAARSSARRGGAKLGLVRAAVWPSGCRTDTVAASGGLRRSPACIPHSHQRLACCIRSHTLAERLRTEGMVVAPAEDNLGGARGARYGDHDQLAGL